MPLRVRTCFSARPILIATGPDHRYPIPLPHRQDGRLLIDATGALMGFGGAPTGIPRVEEFLVRAALSDPDPRIGAVKLSRRLRRFRFLHEGEREQLMRSRTEAPVDPAGARHSALLQAFRAVRDYPAAGREADRYLADMITSGRRRGIDFQTTKALLRAYRAYRRIRIRLAQPGRRRMEPDLNGGDTILLCNTTVLGSSLAQALSGPARPAAICHDLIPILQPDFAVNADHARRFSESLRLLMEAGTSLLCASRWTVDGLAARLAGTDGPARIGRFPMPSILFESAGSASATCEPETDNAIVYCSTVEVRKNHLLLARVWQKAADAGIALPKLVCVGKWGWGNGEFEAYLRAHPGLKKTILFTGAISDAELATRYRRSLFGVFPSRMEGWGYGASECLDFGLPVIVSSAPALLEATGGLMPSLDPDDTDGWLDMVHRMSRDGAMRQRLRETIRNRHRPVPVQASWDAVKANFLAGDPRAASGGKVA